MTHRVEASQRRTDTRQWVMDRRERTRHLIELGGLVQKAGLIELTDDDRAVLLGSFLAVAAKLQGDEREQPLLLDLGEAREIAEIWLNGRRAGAVWRPPYSLDISALAKRGRNQLEVRVANLWTNRLIGDQQPGSQKITWTELPTYKADAPLRRSGLIGPVRLISEPN